MKIQIVTARPVDGLSLSEAKEQLRIETTVFDHDAALRRYIKAAHNYAESITGRTLVQTTYDYWIDRWPPGNFIELPRPPLSSITSVAYTKWDSSSATLTADDDYVADTDSEPGRVVLEYDETWPTDELHPKNPIKIRYVGGYTSGSSPTDYRENIPEEIRIAMLMLVAHWFNQREATITGVNIQNVPMGAIDLLTSKKIWTW
jgi:uncharacterized phiE125 gp8 family phage protein